MYLSDKFIQLKNHLNPDISITHNYINIAQDEIVYNFKQNDFYPFLFVALFDGTSPYPKSQIPERYGSIQFVKNGDTVITPKKVN